MFVEMSMSSEIDLFWVTIDLGWIQSLFLSEKLAFLIWLLLYLGFWVWWRLSYRSFFVEEGGKYGLHEAGIQIWCFPETRPSLVFLSLSLFFLLLLDFQLLMAQLGLWLNLRPLVSALLSQSLLLCLTFSSSLFVC